MREVCKKILNGYQVPQLRNVSKYDLNCGNGTAAAMNGACNNGPGIAVNCNATGQTAGPAAKACNGHGTSAVYNANNDRACVTNGIVASNLPGGPGACSGNGGDPGNYGGCVQGFGPA